jgi:arylsulfatase A-like enzyme
MTLNEYRSGSTFPGVIGRTTDVSTPAWPEPVRARDGAPNVMFIVLDDTGYSQFGCYGSSIETPSIDALAAAGLLYTSMHTTALCSPSRSCVMTGRNHHSNGMAGISEMATGFPGYNARIPFENGFLSEILLAHGYSTFHVGKWHLMPSEFSSAAGPFDRWPLGRGFERFYGFLGGDTSQWTPELTCDNQHIEPPRKPEEGYHLTEDMAEKAIELIADLKQVAPDKPFFLNFWPGATHAPHHVAKEWADRYTGRFDDGWEALRVAVLAGQKELGIMPADTELSRHDPDVPAWETLSDDARRLAARMMEIYAGFLAHTDHQIGRVLEFLREIGELDNTLVMLTSDNGASAEGGTTGTSNELQFFNFAHEPIEESLKAIDELGGPSTFNHYPWGWAWAGNAPMRRWKRETYRGGTAAPFVVHWPDGIASRGEVRTQYTHLIDMAPTVLDVLAIDSPAAIKGYAQTRMHGVSFAHTFDDAKAPTRHRTQYFEMIGHRAIDHEGWRAVCPWPGPSFAEVSVPFSSPISEQALRDLDEHGWELYHIAKDPPENHDLSAEHPDRLAELVSLWYIEAGRHEVFPIDANAIARLLAQRPHLTTPSERYTYRPGTHTVPQFNGPRLLNRPHSITADAETSDKGSDGVLMCQGTAVGGWTFYIKDGRLHYSHNYVRRRVFTVASPTPLPSGRHQLRYEFEPTGEPEIFAGKGAPGRAQLYIDGALVAQLEMPYTTPVAFNPGGLHCGANPGSPVVGTYEAPFSFTGRLHTVVIDVSGELITDTDAEMAAAMAHQ